MRLARSCLLPNTLNLCLVGLLGAACGGRTEVLRQRQARNVADGGVLDGTADGGRRDLGGGSDAGPSFDSSVADVAPCVEEIQAEPLTVPRPGDFFSPFRVLVDATSFYVDRREGRSRQIITRAINGGQERQLNIELGAEILGVANGRILTNNTNDQVPVGIYRDGQHTLFEVEGRAEIQEGADFQYISGQRAAWRNRRDSLFILNDLGLNGQPVRAGQVVAGPAVAGNVVTWAQRANGFELIIDTPADIRAVAIQGQPEWMATSTREVSYVVNGEGWVVGVAGAQQPQFVVGFGVEDQCVAVVAGENGPVFLCINEFNDQLNAYFVSGGVARLLGLRPGVLAAAALDGRFFSYVVFPEGEGYCPGGTPGAVIVHDLLTSIDYEVGSVTSPCLCCDRLSHTPRVQVAGNVALWTGEGPDLTLEFGAVRMQSVCVDDD